MGIDYGTHFFKPGAVQKGKAVSIMSLDAKEITKLVLHQLPDVTVLDKETYKVSHRKVCVLYTVLETMSGKWT